MTDLTVDAWDMALADVSDQAFSWAADRILKEPGRTFFPTPNEIRAHLGPSAFATDRGLLGDGDATADAIGQWYASLKSKRVQPSEASID